MLLRSSRPGSAKTHRFVSANGARVNHKLHEITHGEQVEDEQDLTKSWLGERDTFQRRLVLIATDAVPRKLRLSRQALIPTMMDLLFQRTAFLEHICEGGR